MRRPFIVNKLLIIILAIAFTVTKTSAQAFIHPGLNQNLKDLETMKSRVLKGEQPYKDAFERLKATDTNFVVKAHAHVLRGPYGKPNIGGDDLSRSANMAYNYAVLWYITQNKTYADKAINIINAWSPIIWDLDYNDAKLLAAWTGHVFGNAAEILRYTHSGWQQKDIDRFTNMLLTVYYPLIRYYYPQANGNWDGAIIHTILSIAIFTDNRKMFDNAVDHFLHAPVNGSIFKYIYPDGQCQESTRDQGHVQLGLGEFAGAAQVAFTQGVDLFSIGDNRIASGYEYTAGYLAGGKTHCYGVISDRAKNVRDDYEYVYRHYTAQGLSLPYTKRAADSARLKADRSILTAIRASYGLPKKPGSNSKTIPDVRGAGADFSVVIPAGVIEVSTGQSIQKALDDAAGTGRWVVLKAGIHKIPTTLKMPSGVTLKGEGISTVLFLDPASGERETIINADDNMNNVTIRDLVIECSNKTEVPSDPNSSRSYRGGYNRGGILFRTQQEGQMKHISLVNVTVQNGTYNGVFINGATDVIVDDCDLNENGVSVPPGQKLLHNLLLTRCSDIKVQDSRLVTSPYGSGVALDHCTNALVADCEIARNGYYGVLITECKNVSVSKNLIEGNDNTGVMTEFLHDGSENITITDNTIHYNNGNGDASYAVKNYKASNNKYAGNSRDQQKISNEKILIME